MKVKICGLTRRADAEAAAALGADYLGVVLSAGFPRSVPAAEAGALVRGLAAEPVAVLVDEDAASAARLGRSLGARVLQLHGDEPATTVAELRTAGPWEVWKSVRARVPDDLERALDAYADHIDGILVEGFRAGVVGGGGAALRLDAFLEVRARIPGRLAVVLAGGLTPDTVEDAVRRFAPDVVDVSSGVEKVRGSKDPDLLRLFLERAGRGAARHAPTLPGPSERHPT